MAEEEILTEEAEVESIEVEETQVDEDSVESEETEAATEEAQDTEGSEEEEEEEHTTEAENVIDDEPTEPEVPEKFVLKVDGEEEEATRDEVIRLAQMGRAAQSRMAEAAKKQEEINNVLEQVLTDPLEAFRQIAAQQVGETRAQELTMEAIHKYVQPFAEEAGMTDEQKQLRQIQRERQALDKQRSQIEASQNAKQQQELESHWRKEYEGRFKTIIDLGVPDNRLGRQILADVMTKALEANYDLQAEDAALIVKQEYQQVVRSLPTGEILKDDPGLKKKLQKKAAADAVEAVKQKRQPTTKKGTAAKPTKSRRRKEHLDPHEFFNRDDIFAPER